MNDFYAREFWRFVLVQQKVAELAKTAIDYPPMQDPASFNLDAVKSRSTRSSGASEASDGLSSSSTTDGHGRASIVGRPSTQGGKTDEHDIAKGFVSPFTVLIVVSQRKTSDCDSQELIS